MKPEPKPWLDRYPVLDEEHHADLEARAAVNELRGKMPREEAEARAHGDYVKERALDAAAHHLLGVKAAHAAQHVNAAKQHGAAYAAAMTAAGADPYEQPPQAVMDRIKDAKQKVYSFKAHPADAFFPVPEEVKDPLQKSLDRLLDLKRQLAAR